MRIVPIVLIIRIRAHRAVFDLEGESTFDGCASISLDGESALEWILITYIAIF